MSITIDVAPEVEQRIHREAAQQGQDAPTLVRDILEERFGATAPQPTGGKPDFFSPEAIAAWKAMIDSFSEGDPEEQRASFEQLKRDLDEDRSGQRSVFGTGFNPPLSQNQPEPEETETT